MHSSLFLFLVQACYTLNLIKNGDFQSYAAIIGNPKNAVVDGYFYMEYQNKYMASNQSCWYDRVNGSVQVMNQITHNTTICADLSSTIPMTLCQNVTMSIGRKYTLSYDLYSSVNQNMKARAYLNGFLLMELYIPFRFSFGTKNLTFYAYSQQNTLCFNETHITTSPFIPNSGRGGYIDNISLILIENQYLNFEFIVDQFNNSITLVGNNSCNKITNDSFQQKFDLYINQNKINYTINCSATNNFIVNIKGNFSFSLNDLKFISKLNDTQLLNSTIWEISITPYKKSYFMHLKQNQIATLTLSKQILVFVNEISSKISALSSVFVFAYFLNMIIDIQFLALFYIFTQIKVIPEYTKKIYHEVLKVIFSTESFIQYTEDLLKVPIQNFDVSFEDKFPEKIEEYKNEEPWFGTYGVSSRVIKSNLSSFFVLIFTFVKIVLLKLVIKGLGIFFPSFLKIKVNIFSQLLTQFCFMIPISLISMEANVINSVDNYSEMIVKIACSLVIFIILILLIVNIFLPSFGRRKYAKTYENANKKTVSPSPQEKVSKIIRKSSKRAKFIIISKKNITSKIEQKVQKIKKRKKIHYKEQAFSMLLMFFIPFMSITKSSKIFLAMNTVSILFRFFGFIGNKKKDFLIKKIVDFLIGFVWLVHHIIFICFFFFEDVDLSEKQMDVVIYLGITAIFTILSLLMLQIINFLISTLMFLRDCFKFFISNLNLTKNDIHDRQTLSKYKKMKKKEKQEKQVPADKNTSTIFPQMMTTPIQNNSSPNKKKIAKIRHENKPSKKTKSQRKIIKICRNK